MLKYWSIKKYGTKLLPCLEKQFGKQDFYTSSQIRTIVYRKDFNPDYLPLGYILFLNIDELKSTFAKEYPLIEITEYKQTILSYLDKKSYLCYLQVLQNAAA